MKRWVLVVAFPPCTNLCVSGSRWFAGKQKEQARSIAFFKLFTKLSRSKHRIYRWAIENPIGIMSTRFRKPNQIIQPWQFGHPETKATCLWLHNLPELVPTRSVRSRMLRRPARLRHACHYASPGADRERIRSKTYEGIAEAMARQWGSYAL